MQLFNVEEIITIRKRKVYMIEADDADDAETEVMNGNGKYLPEYDEEETLSEEYNAY